MVKNEKEMLCTVDGIDWEIFMVSGLGYSCPELELRTPGSLEVQQPDLCWSRIPNFSMDSRSRGDAWSRARAFRHKTDGLGRIVDLRPVMK